MRGSDLSAFVKGQINALRFIAHYSYADIHLALHVNINSIKTYCQRINHGGGPIVNRKGRCGRSKCTTEDIDRTLIQTSRQNRFASAKSLQTLIPQLRTVTVQTVRKRLCEG